MSKELVNHPLHYNSQGRKECWDEMIDLFGFDAVVSFDVLNAYKYLYRAGLKEGNPETQDLKKIQQYINHAEKYVGKCSPQTQAHFLVMKDILEGN